MTSADPRPRIVEVAFWCWVAAAILLVLGGLLAVTTGVESLPGKFPGASLSEARSLAWFFRGIGVISIALGLGVGYLAGPTRRGDKRFRRAAVALSFAIVLLLVIFALLFGIVLPLHLLAMILLIVAAVSATRDKASAWFDAVDSGRENG